MTKDINPKKVFAMTDRTNAIVRLYFTHKVPKGEQRLRLERRPFVCVLDSGSSLSLSVWEKLSLLSVVLWFASR